MEPWAAPLISLAIAVGGFLVSWGMFKSSLQALTVRVCTLETEINAIGDLKVEIAVLKTQNGALLEQMKDMNASIRWLRDPAPFGQPPPR